MDRYVIRERRVGADYPEGNQMITFSATSTGNNITIPENVYYRGFNADTQHTNMHYSTPGLIQQVPGYLGNIIQPQAQVISGIDPRYLAAYSDNSGYIAHGQHGESNPIVVNAFGSDYQNRNFVGAERNENKRCVPQRIPNVEGFKIKQASPQIASMPPPSCFKPKNIVNQQVQVAKLHGGVVEAETPKKQVEIDLSKNEVFNPVKTRSEKLKELHKTGIRVFTGTVENILKWNKSLRDIGVTVIYEIIGTCVSIRQGESCAKILVVRDDNGPAMQVLYYEIDYLLPELGTPCTIRVIGRIQPGTSRLHAFSVRNALGDDIATLARRAAVAAHHVTKLCKEYS